VFALEKNQEQEPEKRRQILDGATRVFLSTGYEGASMSVIAQAAGVSKGTLYVYFTNKEALFNAVVEDYCRIHAEPVFDSLDAGTPLDVALFDCGRRYVTALTNAACQAIYRLAIAESAKFPELGRMFFETGPQLSITRVADFLKARVAGGELVIEDFELAAAQFLELCRATCFMPTLLKVTEQPSPERIERVAADAVRIFLAAYRPH
jgi:AcrR family transcriptional regulator